MKLREFSVLMLLMLFLTLGWGPCARAVPSPTVCVDPFLSFANPNETFTVDIDIHVVRAPGLFCWQVNMTFDASVLQYVNVTEGDFLKDRPGGTLFTVYADKASQGEIFFGAPTAGAGGTEGSGTLATVEFKAIAKGESIIKIDHPDTKTFYWDPGEPGHGGFKFEVHSSNEDGYFTSDVDWLELFNLYNQLLVNYNSLLTDYYSLNSSYYSLLHEYQDLLSNYDDLESDYGSLNTTYTSLLGNHTQLQTDYDYLLSQYNDLESSYGELETTYSSLNSTYDSLKTDYDNLKSTYKTNAEELGIARTLNYVLMISIIVLVASTVYLALKKKLKSSK